MKKFHEVMTGTSVLCCLTSVLLFVGSQFPGGEYWFGAIALVSMMILGATGVSEWIYAAR